MDNLLLYINPTEMATEPRDISEYKWLEEMFQAAVKGSVNYLGELVEGVFTLGLHRCVCGEFSSSGDYLLPNGMVTNSLCLHYLQHHYDEVPKEEFRKLRDLKNGVVYKKCSQCKKIKNLEKYKRCEKCRHGN